MFAYLFVFVLFKMESLYAELALLKLSMQNRLTSNSEIYLPLPTKC